MKRAARTVGLFVGCLVFVGTGIAGDWPQWRGANRDATASDFTPPEIWPKQLTQKWKASVGGGVSSPALVGDKVYAFGRVGNEEVTTCLEADTGKEVWKDKYETSVNVTGPAASYSGPRSSPAVADGKVVTLDEGATLSCLDAASGKVVWRKDFTKDLQQAWPQFYTALSPLIMDGTCVAHLGGRGKGMVVALDLNTGDQKWKWDGEGPAYASPVLMTIDGSKVIVQETERAVIGLGAADGKLLFQIPFGGGGRMGGGGGGGRGGPGGGGPPGGAGGPGAGPGAGQPGGGPPGGGAGARPGGPAGGPGGAGGGGRRGGGGGMGGGGMAYNAATPIIDGNTIILSAPGQGTKAFKIEKTGDAYAAKDAWANPDVATQFNTPVLKDGKLYGVSNQGNLFCLDAATGKTLWTGGDRLGERGFGSVVAAGPVLLALTPTSDLVVFKPSGTAFEQVARIRVADTPTNAYPIPAGNRLVVKDRDSVIMYAFN
jgi:outer membrane protein assembly factor BamB